MKVNNSFFLLQLLNLKEEKERAKAEAAAAVAAATGGGLASDSSHYSYSRKDVKFSLDDFEGTFFLLSAIVRAYYTDGF
jgi:hypothetical protein